MNCLTSADLPSSLNTDLEEKVVNNLSSDYLKAYLDSRTKLTTICGNFDFTIFQVNI